MKWEGHIVGMGDITYEIFVAKCEGVRATWETQSKWEENIKNGYHRVLCKNGNEYKTHTTSWPDV
jgi:hypothetical protein